jgi:acyl carrier protein
MAAFRQALGRQNGHLLVMAGDGERIRQRMLQAPRVHDAETKGIESTAGSGASATDRLRAIEQAVLRRVSDVIGVRVADLDTDGEFTEYGFDSISLTVLSNRINAEWNLELSPAVFFEYTTPGDFANFLHDKYGAGLAARLA